MRKQITLPLLLISLLFCGYATAQVKIGDNPQTIDPTSVLELESTERVLVITRVDSLQMARIVPSRGALVYNTSADCVFYYNGTDWINLCGGGGSSGELTADPIVNEGGVPTIALTPTPDGTNIEIAPNSISSNQIVDGGINGVDIQNGSIGRGKLQNNSVDRTKLAENSVGPFAIDNDSIDLSDFNNTTGFIRAADVISADANNSIVAGADGGAFYDNTTLQNSVNDNTAAIAAAVAADEDTDSGNELITDALINESNQLVLTEGGVETTIDLSTLAGTGSNNIAFEVANDSLKITDEGGTLSVPLNQLASASGSDNTLFQVVNDSIQITYAGGTLGFPIAALGTATGGSNNSAFTVANDSLNITDAAGTLSIPLSDVGNPNVTFAVVNDTLSITDESGTLSVPVADIAVGSNNTAFSIVNDSLAITDNLGTLTVPLDSIAHTGTPNSLFFAGADGRPVTTETSAPNNDEGGLYWDPTARFNSGALYIGLKKDSPEGPDSQQGNNAKLVIAERPPISLGTTYPLQLVNESDVAGATSGILFSVTDQNEGTFGRGGLVYERNLASGRGDFHFLQNKPTDAAGEKPEIEQKAFTIKNNGDIQLYGNFIDKNSAVPTEGQVLTTTANGTEWADPGNVVDGTNALIEVANDSLVIQDANGRLGVLLTELNSTGASTDNQNLETATLTGTNLTINIEGGNPTTADLSTLTSDVELAAAITDSEALDNDTDNQNEIQAITSNDGSITVTPNGEDFDLAVVNNGTVNQNLGTATLSGTDLTINIDGGNSTTADLGTLASDIELAAAINASEALDNDTDDENEIELPPGGNSGEVLSTDGVGNYDWVSPSGGLSVVNTNTSTFSGDGTAGSQLDIEDGGIVGDMIEDGEVTSSKIAAGGEGQVLTTRGTNVVWESATTGSNLQNTDLIQTTGQDRTYNLNGQTIYFTGDGNVGIGKFDFTNSSSTIPNSAEDKLHVLGQIRTNNGFAAAPGTANLPSYGFYTNDDNGTGMYRAGNRQLGFSTNGTQALRITIAQNIGIGPNFNATNIEARLHVDGDVRADGAFISSTEDIQPIPDYVFNKYFKGKSKEQVDYQFKSLEEIEIFIKKNNHLPGIKSATKAKKEGFWNLSQSNLQNLEKIEELYLHTIEQEKKINTLQSENNALSDELEALRNDLNEIKEMLKKSN